MSKRTYSPEELQKRTQKVGLSPTNPTEIYKEAFTRGMSMSAYLEQLDPSDEDDSLDAFSRQVAVSGIRTKSDPARGVYADKVDRFYASDSPASVILFPEFLNRQMRLTRLQQDYTNEIIAVRTPVDNDVYRTIYIDVSDVTQSQMKRVSERTEIPTARLKTSENVIKLFKYGLAIEASYETVRRMRIDLLGVHLNYVGLQTALDKLGTAADVLINGDGNSNAATNYNLTTLDVAATAGTLTYKGWLAWLMKFYPYHCTTVMGNQATILKVLTMQFPGVDPLMLLAKYSGGSAAMDVEIAQNVFVPIRLVIASTLANDVLVGIDKQFGLEEVTEIGATLTETDKIIKSQYNEIVISEVVGYGKMYAPSILTLTISA